MFRPLAVNIGLRYARSRRSFISFVTGLSLAGLALSVAVLVFVQAVVAGFEREMNERVLAMVPHVTLAGDAPVLDYAGVVERIRGVEGVVGVSAVVQGAGLLKHGERLTGVRLTGVDPGSYPAVSRVFEFVQGGDGVDLPPGGFHVILGVGIAERLGVVVGDEISVMLPATVVTPLGVFARQKKLRVSGILDTHSMLDRSSAYLHRTDAARLFRLGAGVHGFEVAVERPLEAQAVRARIRRALIDDWHALGLPALWDSSWIGTFGNLHKAIQTTKNMLFLLLSLLVAVAAFNLVSSLVMIVNERRGDIAILRTMGSHSVLVVGVFAVVGIVIAVVGVGLGIAVGLGLGIIAEAGFPWLEQLLGTKLMGEYLITALPVDFALADVARVAGTALALGVAATLVPAWRAARLRPAEVLQHE